MGQDIQEEFYARMYVCAQPINHEGILAELETYNFSDREYNERYQKCVEIAPDYSLDIEQCRQISSSENINKRIEQLRIYKEGSLDESTRNKLVQAIPDKSNGCYWIPDGISWSDACVNSICKFGYFQPPEFKLLVYIPSEDKVYLSNIIERKNFYSTFDANIDETENMIIEDATSFGKSDFVRALPKFFTALLITLIIELLITWSFVAFSNMPRKAFLWVVYANIITLPLLWFAVVLSRSSYNNVFFLAEFLVFLFEGGFIYFVSKKQITFRKSFWLSFIMNLLSMIIGTFFIMMLFFYR
jgi:hypothetical protein